jgi:hypothetical protein
MKKLNSKLQSEGAEFLVLGNLLVEGVACYKAYNYQKGFDLVATWPEKNKSARIQVKSRYASDASHFLIKNFDCDFVVFVSLNREFRYRKNKNGCSGKKEPEFFVFTAEEAKALSIKKGWGRITKKKDIFDQHKDGWQVIKNFGEGPTER